MSTLEWVFVVGWVVTAIAGLAALVWQFRTVDRPGFDDALMFFYGTLLAIFGSLFWPAIWLAAILWTIFIHPRKRAS